MYVCTMNSAAARQSVIIVACPTTRTPPLRLFGERRDRVEAEEREHRDGQRAEDRAGRETPSASKNGARLQCAPFTPRLTATAPSTTNSASTISSPTRKILLARAVVSMPNMLTAVLNTTNATTHAGLRNLREHRAHRGRAGDVAESWNEQIVEQNRPAGEKARRTDAALGPHRRRPIRRSETRATSRDS